MHYLIEWEYIGYLILSTSGIYHVIGQAFLFKGLGEALTKFTTNYTELSSQLHINEVSVYKRVYKRMLLLSLMALPMVVNTFIYFGFYLYYDIKKLTKGLRIVIGALKMVVDCFTLIPPTTAGLLPNFIL